MKEDLFVRPDGQPVVFLMGDVREREKVVSIDNRPGNYQEPYIGESIGGGARWGGA